MKTRIPKIELSWPLFLISVCWLLMTAFPPRHDLHIDYARLGLQYLGSAVLIAVLNKRSRFDFHTLAADNLNKAQLLHAIFKGFAVLSIVSCFALVAPDIKSLDGAAANSDGTTANNDPRILVRKSVFSPKVLIKTGTVITNDMVKIVMLNESQIPADAATGLTKIIGATARHDIEPDNIILQQAIEPKK